MSGMETLYAINNIYDFFLKNNNMYDFFTSKKNMYYF